MLAHQGQHRREPKIWVSPTPARASVIKASGSSEQRTGASGRNRGGPGTNDHGKTRPVLGTTNAMQMWAASSSGARGTPTRARYDGAA